MYRESPESARYIQVLDHIPLANNRARVIVRHYRKFLKNKLLCKLILFSLRQRSIFYSIFTEDYLALKAQTFNQQMGYMNPMYMKLLAEDKAISWYWDWYEKSLKSDCPWDLNILTANTNSIHEQETMFYPPENPKLARIVENRFRLRLLLRLTIFLVFIALVFILFSN
jgi:hypothetical protein